MRKYQPLWEQIKKDPNQSVSIAADTEIHSRIIKAVTKEKNNDLGWKYMMAEAGKRYKLQYNVSGSLIMFYLIDDTPITTDSL